VGMAARIRNTGGGLKKKRNIKKVNYTKKYIAYFANQTQSTERNRERVAKRSIKKGGRKRG
jgi:hypothetical protein